MKKLVQKGISYIGASLLYILVVVCSGVMEYFLFFLPKFFLLLGIGLALFVFLKKREALTEMTHQLLRPVLFILVSILYRPCLELLIKAKQKAKIAKAQSYYNLTGKVPVGYSVEGTESTASAKDKCTDQRESFGREPSEKAENKHPAEYYERLALQEYYEMQYAEQLKILEKERNDLLQKKRTLEEEKKRIEKDQQTKMRNGRNNEVSTDLFAGCTDEDSVKKRYRELLKIYHPDNQNGNTAMVEEVTKQYECVKKQR